MFDAEDTWGLKPIQQKPDINKSPVNYNTPCDGYWVLILQLQEIKLVDA